MLLTYVPPFASVQSHPKLFCAVRESLIHVASAYQPSVGGENGTELRLEETTNLERPEIEPDWAEIGQIWPDIGETQPKLARNRRKFADLDGNLPKPRQNELDKKWPGDEQNG